MPIPEKRADLVAMGYVFNGEGKCRWCGAEIEWWITPHDKKMPMSVKEIRKDPENPVSPVVDWIRIVHWKDCPNAGDFRRPGKK